MKLRHTLFCTSFVLLMNSAWGAQTINYGGNLNFAVTSNVSAVNFETNVTDFKNLKATVEAGKLQSAEVELDPETFETGLTLRDDHMNEKVFKEKPVLIRLKSCEAIDASNCKAAGEIEIAGVKKEITFDIKHDPEFKKVQGQTLLSLKKLDIEAPSYMGVVIEDEVNVKFELSSK